MKISNAKRPLPPNMSWYAFLRTVSIIGGVFSVVGGLMSLTACRYTGFTLFSAYYIFVGLYNLAYGATLIWLFGNMLYLTKTVYKVFTALMASVVSFHCVMISIVGLCPLDYLPLLGVEYAWSEIARSLMLILYAILNLVYIRKRKHYFGFATASTQQQSPKEYKLFDAPLKEDGSRIVCDCIKSHTLHQDGHISTKPFNVSTLSFDWQKYLADDELYFYLENVDGKIKRIITTKANWEEKLALYSKAKTTNAQESPIINNAANVNPQRQFKSFNFDAVKSLILDENMQHTLDDENELFLYEKIWSILTKHRLTVYSDEYVKYLIYVRIYVMVKLFSEFADLLDGCDHSASLGEEVFDYSELQMYISIPDFAIGFLCRALGLAPKDDDEALYLLVHAQVKYVCRAIFSEITVSELYSYMIVAKNYADPFSPGYSYEESGDLLFVNVEEFCKYAEENCSNIINGSHSDCGFDAEAAFAYLCELPYAKREETPKVVHTHKLNTANKPYYAPMSNSGITEKKPITHLNKRICITISAAILAIITASIIAWNAGHNTADLVTPDGSKTVYITPAGEKYHRKNCKTIKANKTAIGIDSAKKSGYTPCSRCKPGK